MRLANEERDTCTAGCLFLCLLGLGVPVGLIVSDGLSLPPLLLAIPALLGLLTVVPSLWRGSNRAGITTDEDGLTELFPLRWRRRIRWVDVQAVEVGDKRAVVTGAGRRVVLALPLGDWLQIALMARERLQGAEPEGPRTEAQPAVTTAQIAIWLGVPAGGCLVCRRPAKRFVLAVACLWCLFIAVYALAMAGYDVPLALIPCMSLLLAFLTARVISASVRGPVERRLPGGQVLEVRALASSIEVRTAVGWRSWSWGALSRIDSVEGFALVASDTGDLWLPADMTNMATLLGAIRRAIEARQAGFSLPRMTGEVPAAALSRAQLSVDAERGLSREE